MDFVLNKYRRCQILLHAVQLQMRWRFWRISERQRRRHHCLHSATTEYPFTPSSADV